MADFDEKCHDAEFHRILSIRATQCVSYEGSQDLLKICQNCVEFS